MEQKKREGIDGFKNTMGGQRRTSQNEVVTINAKNIVTVMYMMQSPEDPVKIRAVASLELFGRKDPENLKLLASMGIFQYLFPLVFHDDYVARRFALKMIGMLSSLEEFREEMFKTKNIHDTFLEILRSDKDVVVQEYSSGILAKLSTEYPVASELLQVQDCMNILFEKLNCPDPDIENNCLQILSHLLNDINGVDYFIESPYFDLKPLLSLVCSKYPVIQSLAILVLTQLTSGCRDTRILIAFRDAKGIEVILQVMEKEEWADLHAGALDLLINLTDSPQICEYLQQCGRLTKFVILLDHAKDLSRLEKILGVLARMAQTIRGREALSSVDIEGRLIKYLEMAYEGIQEVSCLGIANLAQNLFSLQKFIEKNPVKPLLAIINNEEKSFKVRNLGAYALNVLCHADKTASEALLQEEDHKGLFTILTDSPNLPTELCQNVIQVFIGISHYHEPRNNLISETLLSALISCLPANVCETKDPSIQVDALDCLSEYMVEEDARYFFKLLSGIPRLIFCLRSKFASVREWAGHLVLIGAQEQDFIKEFIEHNGLDWMMREKNTMHSMPSWQSAIDTIFANYLPVKFAYTGRLDFHDITQEGFFISTNPKIKFIVLDNFYSSMASPVVPIYVANFEPLPPASEHSKTSSLTGTQIPAFKTVEPPSFKKLMKGADRNSLEDYVWDGTLPNYPSFSYNEIPLKKKSVTPPTTDDSFLNEYLENLKRKIAKEELPVGDMSWSCLHPTLVCNRARIIAELVADEMSGPEPTPGYSAFNKQVHLNELKYYLGTNILPLGLIRAGDYLERAMLFKVLADRIGFPCAFVRGSNGRAWIEISVPVINVEDSEDGNDRSKIQSPPNSGTKRSSEVTVQNYGIDFEKSVSQRSIQTSCPDSVNAGEAFWLPKIHLEAFKGYPSDFLKPNVIVDLIHEPGRLLNLRSFEAEEYCGNFIFK